MQTLKNVKELILHNNYISDATALQKSKFKKLKKLNLRFNKITDEEKTLLILKKLKVKELYI